MIKQDIRIYIYMLPIAGQTAGPIGLSFFCRHLWAVWGCKRPKKVKFFFLIFVFHGQHRALQQVVLKFVKRKNDIYFIYWKGKHLFTADLTINHYLLKFNLKMKIENQN